MIPLRHLVPCTALAAIALFAILPAAAQASPPWPIQEIQTLRAQWVGVPSPTEAQRAALARAGLDIWRRLKPDASNWTGSQFAWFGVEIVHLMDTVQDVDGGERVIVECEAILLARGGEPHGLPCLHWKRTGRAFDHGSVRDHAPRWEAMWRQFEGPKRFWVAARAGRALLRKCEQPALADQLLTEALSALAAHGPWDDRTRLQLVADHDIEIEGPFRSTAASFEETRAELLLLRGVARERIGRLLLAMKDLQEARAGMDAVQNIQRSANCDHSMAGVWLQLGRSDRAIESARLANGYYRSIPAYWRTAPQYSRDDNGVIAMTKLEAQALLQRGATADLVAAEQRLAGLFTDNKDNVRGETNIDALPSYASVLLRLPRTESRYLAFEQVMSKLEEASRHGRALRANRQAVLLRAEAAVRNGDAAAAQRCLDQVVGLIKDERVDIVVAYHRLRAQCRLAMGDPLAAFDDILWAAECIVAVERAEALWLSDGVTIGWSTQFSELLDVAHQAYQQAILVGGDPQSLVERLYGLVQRFHGLTTMSWMQSSDALGCAMDIAERDAKYADIKRALLVAEERQRSQALVSKGTPRSKSFAKRLATDVEGLRIAKAARFSEILKPERTPLLTFHTMREVQADLAEEELWVECCETPTSAWAFVVSKDHCELVPLPAGDAWRSAVAGIETWVRDDVVPSAGAGIDAMSRVADLLLPAEGRLTKLLADSGRTRVLWSPEGTFASLPIAALPLRGRPLVEQLVPVHVISGSRLVTERQSKPLPERPRELLAFANPWYPPADTELNLFRSLGLHGLSRLPATAAEAVEIAQFFANAAGRQRLAGIMDVAARNEELFGIGYRLLLGDQAVEGALTRERLGSATVLHFACHGEARSDSPGMSYLALSLLDEKDPRRGGKDGLVHLGELAALHGDFELITLSGCRTAAGATNSHDAVAGLAWAAQMAGARRVLATLWQVGDESTRKLVVAVYRAWLVDKLPLAEALAKVQRQAIADKVPVRQWAALVLWGSER